MPRLADEVTGEHQIVLLAGARRYDGNKISVSCRCLRRPRPGRWGRGIIEARSRFPLAEALTAWRTWHEQNGVPL